MYSQFMMHGQKHIKLCSSVIICEIIVCICWSEHKIIPTNLCQYEPSNNMITGNVQFVIMNSINP